ncbi:BRO family protein [Gulosibacter sp. GYB002]|uniref:phage antirepressor n=1 Tax=Gulosibacter sp. GYB002 TaxID=2994391 RepID=UPI002F961473
MSTDILPFQFESHEVRALMINDEPWVVAADVCRVLEIGNPSQALTRLDEDEVTLISNEGRQINAVNEPGLYSLILGSRKPQAKAFKRWITHEVIPSIRKTGGYGQRLALTDEEIVAQALQITTAKVMQLEAKVEEDKPKVEYVDSFVAVEDDVLIIRDAAQVLGVKESELRDALTNWGWAYRKHVGQRWSDSHGRMIDVYEWRAYAEHADKFQLRPQHNAPRHHNGQVRQTLYVRAFALAKIAERLGVEPEHLIDEVA